MRRLAGITTLLLVFTSFVGQASARILFQDDTTGVFESENMVIGSNDSGANNTSITLGADGTASENGKINWNITTNTFEVDHTTAVTGGLSATGQVNFSGAAGMRIREVADEAAASCATVKEIVLDTTENKLYICTATGTPGTWTSASPAAGDFETTYATDADKTLTTSNGAFTIAAGSGAVNVNSTNAGGVSINASVNGPVNIATGTSTGLVTIGGGSGTAAINTSDWDITTTGAMTGIGAITMDGLLTGTAGATMSGAAVSLNNNSNFAVNIGTGTSTGAVGIGGGSNTVAIDSSDWDITTTGAMTGIGAITMDGLLTGTAGATMSGAAVSLNNNSNFAVNIGTGTSTGAVGIGGGANTVAIDTTSWDISSAGAVSGLTGLTSTGTVNLSGTGAFRVREVAGITNPGTACTTVGELIMDTVDQVLYSCTNAGTDAWQKVGTGSDAGTLDGIDSASFLRSDASDNYTSGTLTLDNGTTLTVNGVANIGDNGDTVAINSSDWDISSTGVMTGISGITNDSTFSTSGGAVNVNASSNFATNINTGTSTGAVSVGGGANTVAIDSSDWDITTTGAMTGIGAITMDGLLTGTAGATLSGAAVSVNNNSNFATNINTGTSTGAVSVGGNANTVAIDSSAWDITTAGAASGFTTIGASGNVTTSGGTFCVGSTCLNETNAAGDNGATLVGTYDEFDNSNSANVQDVLDDLDAKIGSNAPNVDELTFYPEYPDVVVYKDGSSNQGTLVSDYDSGNSRQYYGWTSTKTALNDIDLRFRYELPADFAATGDLTLQIKTLTTNAADNAVDLTINNETDTATCATSTGNKSSVANTWATVTVSAASINTGCTGGTALNSGDIIEVIIKNYAKSTGESDVGKIQLDYTN